MARKPTTIALPAAPRFVPSSVSIWLTFGNCNAIIAWGFFALSGTIVILAVKDNAMGAIIMALIIAGIGTWMLQTSIRGARKIVTLLRFGELAPTTEVSRQVTQDSDGNTITTIKYHFTTSSNIPVYFHDGSTITTVLYLPTDPSILKSIDNLQLLPLEFNAAGQYTYHQKIPAIFACILPALVIICLTLYAIFG